MTRQQANYILDKCRAGMYVRTSDVKRALIVTGDLDKSQAKFRRVSRYG